MKGRSYLMLLLSVALMIVSVSTAGCIGQVIEDITPQEASELIDENWDNPDFIIIDVRTPSEFIDGHIDNAINIDFRSQSFESEISKLDKGKIYLIYCKSGGRSRGALDIMVQLSFKEVYHLSAGISGWLIEGFPIIK